ncbi:hypothetical protein [Streptomyces sp. NPDC002758]
MQADDDAECRECGEGARFDEGQAAQAGDDQDHNELWLDIPDGIAPAYAPDLTLGSCASGIRATATDNTPAPIRDFIGFEIERREAGASTWSVVLHQGFDPRFATATATATVCDPLPADGRTYEYCARTYDAAGNHSPNSEIRAMTVPVG